MNHAESLIPEELTYSSRDETKITDYFNTIYNHDRPTALHCLRVAKLCLHAAAELTYNLPLELLYAGGLLHDYGKTKLTPKDLWPEKHGEFFDDSTRERVRMHAEIGFELLKGWNSQVALIAGAHHYHKDGIGYGICPGRDTQVNAALEIIKPADCADAIVTRDDPRQSQEVRNSPIARVAALKDAHPGSSVDLVIDLTRGTQLICV